jgi:hypothetical protein
MTGWFGVIRYGCLAEGRVLRGRSFGVEKKGFDAKARGRARQGPVLSGMGPEEVQVVGGWAKRIASWLGIAGREKGRQDGGYGRGGSGCAAG